MNGKRRFGVLAAIAGLCALLVFLVAGLLTSIFERKQEARNPYVRLVEVNEETTDPAAWGVNWPRE
jgi:nitrite reductase (cytochrome c-552)